MLETGCGQSRVCRGSRDQMMYPPRSRTIGVGVDAYDRGCFPADTRPFTLESKRRTLAPFLPTLSPLLSDVRVMLRLTLREEQMLREEQRSRRIRAAGVVLVTGVLASLLIGSRLMERSGAHQNASARQDVSSPSYVMSDRSPTPFDPSLGSVPAQQPEARYECTDGGERLLKERSCAIREGAGASGRRSEWAGTEDALRWNFRRPQ